MATIARDVFPGPYALPAANFAAPTVIAGANFSFPALLFDAATAESVHFPLRAHNYGSGSLTVDIEWYADTASAGDVSWNARIAAITPNTDAIGIEAKTPGAGALVVQSHLGTTGQRLHRATITVPDVDALVAGDLCWLVVQRNAASGSDTMAGDAIVVGVTISYSDV